MTDISTKAATIFSYCYHNFLPDEARQEKRNSFYRMWDLTSPLAELVTMGAAVPTPGGEAMIAECYDNLLHTDPEYINQIR